MKLFFFGSDARAELSSFLLISHRWAGRCHPDASQEQRNVIAEWLSQNPDKDWVWFDYCSLPQDFKDEKGDVVKAMGPEDKAYFRHVLAHINYAYLLFDVLTVYDQDYMTRFWSVYEAFLAMHSIVGGVIAQIERREAEKRCRVVCVGMVPQKSAALQKKEADRLWDFWGEASVDDALDQLQRSDIRVTNSSDKPEQIQRLQKLTERVKEYHGFCVSRREELWELSTGDLLRRAALLDVGGEKLDAAYSAVDTKAFLVELLLPMDEDPRLVRSGVAALRADADRSRQELEQKLVKRVKELQEIISRFRGPCSGDGKRCVEPSVVVECRTCGAEWACVGQICDGRYGHETCAHPNVVILSADAMGTLDWQCTHCGGEWNRYDVD